ncbi:MAG: tRNA (adenosine(37)-N6)-dimethylallyltransferase MiaA [Candidatus Saccharimonadales bacterium]
MKSSVGPLIVVVGTTASGKSELSIKLSERFNGEIICADSTTIYRGFDIGSAKPNDIDRRKIHHYLLDVADPHDDFNAAMFQRLAYKTIKNISSRDKLPFLVGGSGLYIDSVLYDYKFLSPPSNDLRSTLNQLSLAELLQEASSMRLNINMVDNHNKRRLIRLIENNGIKPERRSLRTDTLIIGLQVPEDILRSNIEQRVDSMLKQGLEKEVRQLAENYGWEIRPMQSIGYHEWRAYFGGEKTFLETRASIINNSLMLTKKQHIWFKRNKSIHWFLNEDKMNKYVDLITTFLNK